MARPKRVGEQPVSFVRHIFVFLHRLSVLPLSPRGLRALTATLRRVGYLRTPALGTGSEVRRILIAYPSCYLGDLVLMLPTIEAVHTQWPDASLEIAVNARTADLLSVVPFVDVVHRVQHNEMLGLTYYRRLFDLISVYRNQMMSKDYDLAVDVRWGEDLFFGKYLVSLTGAPIRCGYSATVDGGDSRWDRFLTRVATGGDHEQEALRDLRLLNRVGLREETPADQDIVDQPIALLEKIAAAARETAGDSLRELLSKPYVVFAPGSSHPRRRWPVDNLAALIDELKMPADTRYVVIGGKDEQQFGEDLVRRWPEQAISLAGKTNLMQLVTLIGGAVLFVGNDSGPAHIAGGLGIPTVVISAFPSSCTEDHQNSPKRFRPCGPKVSVVQPRDAISPCPPGCTSEVPHCITQVTVEQVLTAANSLVGSSPDRKS